MKSRKAAALVLVMACLAASACGNKAPRKPSGVPADASWHRYGNESAFIIVTPAERGLWHVKAWHDFGITMKADGLYELHGAPHSAIQASDIEGFDEGVLRLKDGGMLVPKP